MKGAAGWMGLGTTLICLLTQGKSAAGQSLSVSGSPSAFNVTTAVAGSEPAGITSSETTYTVANLEIQRGKISAKLNAAMPTGTTITVSMVAPSGATTLGAVTLDAIDRDLVTNIRDLPGSTQGMTITFTATTAAGVLASVTRTITYTFVHH